MASETVLFNALSGDPAITAIVKDKIYSDIRVQGDDIPAIYYERSSTEFLHTLDSFYPYGETASFIVICFEKNRELSNALATLIITATANNNFLCNDKGNGYDEESETYYTTLQMDFLDIY